MTALHGGCCGPPNARNVHRDCPGVWTAASGVPMRCGCPCHAETPGGMGDSGAAGRYDRGTSEDGPERGVGTSGRGLADWIGVD